MKLLKPGAVRRLGGPKPINRLLMMLEPERVDIAKAQSGDVTRELGASYEQMIARLDDALELVQKVESIGGLMRDIREPVRTQFEERKAEFAELSALRLLAEQSAGQLAAAKALEQNLRQDLQVAKNEGGDLRERLRSAEDQLQSAQLEVEEYRNAHLQAEKLADELSENVGEAWTQIGQLQKEVEDLNRQLALAEEQRQSADAALDSSRQDTLLLNGELAVLRRHLDESANRTAQLERTVGELENSASTAWARNAALERSVETAKADVARVTAQLEARLEAQRSQLEVTQARLSASVSQAETLKGLNEDLLQRNQAGSAREATTLRRISELQIDLERSQDRAGALEQELANFRDKLSAVEAARGAAVERSHELSKALNRREATLRRTSEELSRAKARLETLQGDHKGAIESYEKRIAELELHFARERAEREIVEGALDSVRHSRASA